MNNYVCIENEIALSRISLVNDLVNRSLLSDVSFHSGLCFFIDQVLSGPDRYRLKGSVNKTIRAVLIMVKERPRQSVSKP